MGFILLYSSFWFSIIFEASSFISRRSGTSPGDGKANIDHLLGLSDERKNKEQER